MDIRYSVSVALILFSFVLCVVSLIQIYKRGGRG